MKENSIREISSDNSIKGYAAQLIEQHHISDGDILIGSSLGGIIASEIANQKDIAQTFLIGSAINRNEIHSLLKLIHPLVDLAPLYFIRTLTGKVPNDLSVMFSESDPEFIRAMCKAIFKWEGLNKLNSVIRIHGKKDLVIPIPENCDFQINGGHLIAMTHPEECLRAIKKSLS